jgi:hypothetical protein
MKSPSLLSRLLPWISVWGVLIGQVIMNTAHGYRINELQKRLERLEHLAERLAPYMEAGK